MGATLPSAALQGKLTAVSGPEDDPLMGSDDVDRVRQAYESFAAGDVQAILDFLDPDVEWRMADDEPDSRTLRGHQQVLQLWAETVDTFESFRFDVEDVLAVFTIRDGKAVRVEEYRTREQAIEAAAAQALEHS
jgi:ketosteroid isomerase-like protein